MNCVKLTSEHHESWNRFCRKNHWFWHHTEWIEYLCHSKHGVEFKDHSFFITRDQKIEAVVPLIQEDNQLISPGFEDRKDVLQEVQRIASENGIKRIQVNSQIREYLNISGYTCTISLDQINPTKGCKSAIKKGEKYLTFTKSNDIDTFKRDYFKISRRITRPDKSFELLERWIAEDFGTLLQAQFNGETAGYIYVLHWQNYAYYFMSGTFPAFREYDVTHFLQTKAFELLRKKGVTHYEMGEQVDKALHCQYSEKERKISKFKRSFGGSIVANPVSEYFFDQGYMIDVYAERLSRYWEISI